MIKFGTGGWRAIIGDDFIRANIVKVATGIAKLAKENGKTDKPICIGYDRRFLSDKAAQWVAEVLCGNGIQVWMMKRSCPTPLVMFTCKNKDLHYGVEITASHNPSEYNGIKIFIQDGRDADVATTERLETLINETVDSEIAVLDFNVAESRGMVEYPRFLFNDFIDSIISRLDMSVIREKGPRILFNPMHGSGTYPLMVLMYTARCTVDLMNANKDAFFGGSLPAPTKETLTGLANRVVSEKYDLGIAVDGDGDRLGIIDSDGTYINANQILAMLYYYLHEYRGWRGPVVRNLATTHMLDMMAKDFGETCYEVPVGFKWISSKLDETDAVLGGESSGGLTVRGHIYGKDSVYAAMLFVEMLSAIGKTPTAFWQELTEKYGSFEMVESNLHFHPAEKERINNLLMVEKKVPDFGKEIATLNYEDGFKVTFKDNSFVICRFSGTEPLLRVFAESSTAEAAEEIIACMKQFIGL